MMELSSEKSASSSPYVYPTDLRVLGYAASTLLTGTHSSGSGSSSPQSGNVHLNPDSPHTSSENGILMSQNEPTSPVVTSSAYPLPRNLLFSESEVICRCYYWSS